MPINIPSTPFSLLTTNQMPPAPVSTVTASTYTFVLADGQAFVLFNSASAQTATIPLSTYPVGTQLSALQLGAGPLTVVPAGGVTMFPNSSANSLTQYSIISFFQTSLNVWIAFGNFF